MLFYKMKGNLRCDNKRQEKVRENITGLHGKDMGTNTGMEENRVNGSSKSSRMIREVRAVKEAEESRQVKRGEMV